jgi:hypothetical protein
MARQRITPGDGDPRHGTINGYTNLSCRCPECRSAWSAYILKRRKYERPQLAADDPRHGKYTTYINWQCRCRPCTNANAVHERERRQKARK